MSEKESKKVCPRIKCDVEDCIHNFHENATCKLDTIEVSNCTGQEQAKSEDGTACYSYQYVGKAKENDIK